MTAYKGDYDTFERTRAEHMKNQQKAFESNERSREHMQVFFRKHLLYQMLIIKQLSSFSLVLYLVVSPP